MFLAEGNVVLGLENPYCGITLTLTLNGESRGVQTILLKATIAFVSAKYIHTGWLTD